MDDSKASTAWKEGRIVRRTLPLGDDAEIVQTLECFGRYWEITSQIIEEGDTSHVLMDRSKGVREAKQIADKHVEQLCKTWAAEGREL